MISALAYHRVYARAASLHTEGPARRFGCTISGSLLTQVHGIFLSRFGYKVSCFPLIEGIQFIDMNKMFIFLLAG